MDPRRREFLAGFSSFAGALASGSVFGSKRKAELWRTVFEGQKQNHTRLDNLREQFALLTERVDGRELVYLDSAATTQRPRAVLDALTNFYLHDNANPAKSLHGLARRAAALYDEARASVARFVKRSRWR